MKVVLDGGDAINTLTTYHSMPLRIPSPDRVSMGISGWAQDYHSRNGIDQNATLFPA